MESTARDTGIRPQPLALVQQELGEVEEFLRNRVGSDLSLINDISRYVHEAGGKRLRPALLLLTSKLTRGPRQPAIQLAAVVELIHVATLIHDDIIDNSSYRRGRPSVNSRWGSPITVLAGDWLYMTAFSISLQQRNFRILDVLIELTKKMVEGELLQLRCNYDLDLSPEQHLDICMHKTAYLFSACGRLAAILGDLDDELEESLARYGLYVGMAFQLIDDFLDFSAKREVLGKPVLKDLEEGTVTLPILHVLSHGTPADVSFIREVVEKQDFSLENKRRILEIVRSNGGLKDLRQKALTYAAQARQSLTALPVSVYRDALAELPDLIIAREK